MERGTGFGNSQKNLNQLNSLRLVFLIWKRNVSNRYCEEMFLCCFWYFLPIPASFCPFVCSAPENIRLPWNGKCMKNTWDLLCSASLFTFWEGAVKGAAHPWGGTSGELIDRWVSQSVLRNLMIFFKVNNQDDKAIMFRSAEIFFIFQNVIFSCGRQVVFKLSTTIICDL